MMKRLLMRGMLVLLTSACLISLFANTKPLARAQESQPWATGEENSQPQALMSEDNLVLPEQVAQGTERLYAGPNIYLDPRYGYHLELPAGWLIYPTDPSAIIGTATLCNYDPQEIEDLQLALPDNAICLQFGVGELANNETVDHWVANRRASEMSQKFSGGYPASASLISQVSIGENEGVAFLLRTLDGTDILEINFSNKRYVLSIGVAPINSPALPEALQVLKSLELMPANADLAVPPTSYEIVDQSLEGLSSDSYGPEYWTSYVLDVEWEDYIQKTKAEIHPMSPTACSGAGSFDKGEASTSPISLWVPFKNGETWTVGGSGSFYGNGWHGNCVNDYYATDWNRSNDYQADVLPAAPGNVTYATSPCLNSGLGCYVQVTHGNGIKTTYGHLSQIYQSSGEAKLGQRIGAVGETGCPGCGPHLHLGFHKLESGSYYSRCNSGINGGKCPNGESPQSPQTPRPSPINTSNGQVPLEDGKSYTSNNTGSSDGSNCPNVTYNGVILYKDKDCRGDARQYNGATSWINTSDFNDVTSSIYVKSGWSVRVYEHANNDQNGGKNRCIAGSMWDLDKDNYPGSSTKINDTISSVQVFTNGSCTGGDPVPTKPIQLYKDPSYGGGYCYVESAGNYGNIDGCEGFNDAISSLLLKSGWSAWVFEHQNFGGGKKCYTGNDPDLSNDQFDNGLNVNDKISSFALYNSSSCPAWEVAPPKPSLSAPSDGATLVEGESINLIWNSSFGATGYYGEITGGPSPLSFGWQSGTSKNIGSQWPGYEYSWRMKASNSAGESPYSDTWKFTVIPKAPSNVNASALSCTSVKVTWTDNSGSEDGYKIYRDGAEIGTVGSGGTSFTDGVSTQTTYNYAVKAYRNGFYSNAGSASVTTPDCPVQPPQPPIIIAPSYGTIFVEGEAITLSWENTATATEYYGEITGGPGDMTFGWQSATSVDIGAQWPGYEYYWQVKARNSGGEGGYTDKWLFTVIPKAPSAISTGDLSCNSVTISWNNNSNSIDGFRIYRNGSEIGYVSANITSYTDQGLQAETSYDYTVRAVRNGITSDAGNTASITTPPCTITWCDAPTDGIVLYSEPNYTGGCITLTADAPYLGDVNFNDVASSIRFLGSYRNAGWQVSLFDWQNYAGDFANFRGDDSDLGNNKIHHDRTTSVRIWQDFDDNRLLDFGPLRGGTIDPYSDTDQYYFFGAKDMVIDLTMNGNGPDSYLVLLNTQWKVLAQDDDSGGDRNARIQYTLPYSGRYLVTARNYSGATGTGTYKIDLSLISSPPCIPGANGIVLYEHANYTGWCVTLTGSDASLINNYFQDMASSIRFVGSYRNAGWQVSLFNWQSYKGDFANFRGDDSDFGNNKIRHDRTTSVRIWQDFDDDRALNWSQPLNGTIQVPSDGDVYTFYGWAGQMISISMSRTDGSQLAPYLALYKPNWSYATADGNSDGDGNALINGYILPVNGIYKVAVRSKSYASIGNYLIELTSP